MKPGKIKWKARYVAMVMAAIVILTAFSMCANNKGYTITGRIEGVESGMAYLEHTYDSVTVKDSAAIQNGEFTFAGMAPEPLMYTLKVAGDKGQLMLFVENKDITIQARKDSLYKADVTGSVSNDVFRGFYRHAWKPVTDKAGGIYRRLDSANQGGKVALDPETRRAFDAEFAALSRESDSITTVYVAAHANSVASAVIIQDRFIAYPNPGKAQELYDTLGEAVKQSVYGREVAASLALSAKTAVGKTAPDFVMIDTLGHPVKLSHFRGQYVLLDFWASWCGPCRKENPNLVKAYGKYHPKGFEIVSVSLDDKRNAWLKAIEKDSLTWVHLSDLKGWNNEAAAAYGVKSVPASYLLDKDGKIVARDLRGEALELKLAEIFNDDKG